MAEASQVLRSGEQSGAHSIPLRSSLQFTSEAILLAWQGKRSKGIGHFAPEISAASCRNHNKLLTGFLAEVSYGSRVRARLQFSDPQFFSGFCIKCEKAVIGCRTDEDQPTRRHDRAAEVGCARFSFQLTHAAERNLPRDFSLVHVN